MYTRAGAFDLDSEGNLVNPQDGSVVQGWMAKWRDGEAVVSVDGPIEDIRINIGSLLKAKPTSKISLSGNLNSLSPLAIPAVELEKVLSLRSLSQVVDGDGQTLRPDPGPGLGIQDCGWNTGRNPHPESRIRIRTSDGEVYESQKLNNENYPTLHKLMEEINGIFGEGFFRYSLESDLFIITPKVEGVKITLEDLNVPLGGIGFFEAINMPTGEHNPTVKERIKFTHLLDAQHPEREYYRWEAVEMDGGPVPMVASAITSTLSTGPNGTWKVSSTNVHSIDLSRPFASAGFDITPRLDSTITIRSSAYASEGGEGVWTSRALSSYRSVDEFLAEVNNQDSAPLTLTYDPVNDRFVCWNDAPGTAVLMEESGEGGFVTIAKFRRYSQDHGANFLWNGQSDVDFTRTAQFRSTTLPAKGIIQLDPETGKVIASYIDTDENQNNVLDLTSEIPSTTAIITIRRTPPRLFGGDLWPHTTHTRGTGKDFFRQTNGQIHESHWVDTPSAGTTITIDLDRSDVNESAIVVTRNQNFVPPDSSTAPAQGTWRFSDNTGPGGVDQIVFTSDGAASDVLFEIAYVRTGYSNLKPSDTFIPNGNEGKEPIVFQPNTGIVKSYKYYSEDDLVRGGMVEGAVKGEGVEAIRLPKDEYIYKRSVEIYDSTGERKALIFNFERLDTNYWLWWVLNPAEDEYREEGLLSGYGILAFDAYGGYDPLHSEVFQSPSDPATFDGDNGAPYYGGTRGYRGIYIDQPELGYPADFGGAPPPEMGAAIIEICPDLLSIIQNAGGSEVTIQANGYGLGRLKGITIDKEGIIWGNYTNEETFPLAQIGIATFSNPEGLSKEGGTTFRPTPNSGPPSIMPPGKGMAGTIHSGRLEGSNVNLSDEFLNLILAERSFQANSRGITTSDRIVMEIMRLRM
jgi:flagellar hook-basal body protein